MSWIPQCRLAPESGGGSRKYHFERPASRRLSCLSPVRPEWDHSTLDTGRSGRRSVDSLNYCKVTETVIGGREGDGQKPLRSAARRTQVPRDFASDAARQR